MKYILILITILSIGCSSEWHLRQAIKKNPKLKDSINTTIVVKDTTIIHDTIIVPRDSVQFTVDSLKTIADSIITLYDGEKAKVEYWINKNNQKEFKIVWKEKEIVRNDTVIKEILVPCNCPPQVEEITEFQKFLYYSGAIAWILLFILFMLYLHKKFK